MIKVPNIFFTKTIISVQVVFLRKKIINRMLKYNNSYQPSESTGTKLFKRNH